MKVTKTEVVVQQPVSFSWENFFDGMALPPERIKHIGKLFSENALELSDAGNTLFLRFLRLSIDKDSFLNR